MAPSRGFVRLLGSLHRDVEGVLSGSTRVPQKGSVEFRGFRPSGFSALSRAE